MKKKFLTIGMGALLCLSSITAMAADPIKAIDKELLASMNDKEKEATIMAVKERLLELKSLDKSRLSKAEKQAIKLEKKNAKAIAAGLDKKVSISIGAIIIAVLLIIIIF